MSLLTCKIVRPDRLLYEGGAHSITLVTSDGELGIYPDHAAEICALGDGVVRIDTVGDGTDKKHQIVVSGGYAEIANNTVIVLADHARNVNDIDVNVVEQTKKEAIHQRDALAQGDHGRAYFEGKIHWCDVLLQQAQKRETA